MANVIAQIKERLSLIDYLNNYQGVRIDERSLPKNISCPLHKDNKPSLRLYSPKENGGYCFSCGKAYDAISVHKELNGLDYGTALRELARDLNIEVTSSPRVDKSKFKTELAKAVKANTALLKQENMKPNIAKNFDIFAKKVNMVVKSGKLRYLYVNRKFSKSEDKSNETD